MALEPSVLMSSDKPRDVHVPGGLRVSWQSLLLLAVVVLGLVPPVLGPLNHDVAWYLYGSRRLMDGARLYVDIEDLNPPLVFYLGAPVEWLALHTGLPELTVMAGAIGVMAIVAFSLTTAIFRTSRQGLDGVARAALAAWLYAVLLMPGFDFGQREHWVVLLVFPYCVACLVAAEGDASAAGTRRRAIVTGLLAGLGFAFKPYFLGALIALWGSVILRRRSLRPLLAVEHLVVAATLAVYALFVLIVTPAYVFDMVPLARAQYWAFGVDRMLLMRTMDVVLLAGGALVAAIGGVMLTRHLRGGIFTQQLGLVSLAFTAAYLVQAKGWFYHLLPAKAFCFIACVVAAAAFALRLRADRAAASSPGLMPALALRAAVIGFGVVPALLFLILTADYHVGVMSRKPGKRPLLDLVRAKATGQPIYILSSSVSPAFPLVNLSGASWPYQYHHLWPLPACYYSVESRQAAYRPPEAQSPIERRLFTTVVEDLTRTPPTLLLVDSSRYKQAFGATDFDYVEYFSQDPAFRQLFADYRRIAHIAFFDVYEHAPGWRDKSLARNVAQP